MFAMAAGASIALLALNFEYNTGNVIAVINPLEKMLAFADADTTDAAIASGPWRNSVAAERDRIGAGALHVRAASLAASDDVSHMADRSRASSMRGRRGERLAAVQALVLLLAAIGIDALTVRRGLKTEYFIFTDPLIILACAVLLESLSDLRFHKWAYPVGAALFVLHIAVGQADPVKYAIKRSGPESICEWSGHYLPLLPLPWCPNPVITAC